MGSATNRLPISHNVLVNEGANKHTGHRHAADSTPKSGLRTRLLALAALVCLAAWAYLVWSAIGFGRTARGGDTSAWLYLLIASVGAIACLFAGLLLVVRLMRSMGVIAQNAGIPRPTGGRRAKR